MVSQSGSGPSAWVAFLSKAAGAIAGILILAMTVTILIDVGGRTFFNRPLPGGVELNRTFLVGIVFLSLALTQLQKGHIRVDILLVRLKSAAIWRLDLISLAMGAVVFAIIAYMTLPVALRSYRIGEYEIGIMNFPMWPARFLLTFGLALFALQLLVDLVSVLRKGDAGPETLERQAFE